ncbi:MAG TPA: MlaD family protein [Solirubrobacteraceae bacterium]|nr:MlaD family protein [Solirubrobacteraceae bacterium]
MRRRGLSPVKVALITLALVGLGSFLAYTKDIPFVNEPYEVRAAFRDASGISVGSPVRIAGVDVGKVTGVEFTRPGAESATVTMAIEDAGRPIHVDAQMAIAPRIFLEGNFFVDVKPGTPEQPELPELGMVPVERTDNPVQFDQVLKLLRRDVRRDLRTAFAELFYAQQAGAGRAFNHSLPDQADAYRFTSVVNEALLGEQPGDLGDWIRDQGVVARAIDRNPRQLAALIANLNTTAGALADREGDLRRAIDALPGTLQEALPTFAAVNDALPAVRRFADAARPGVRSTGPTAEALLPLLGQLRGLVSDGELRGLSSDLRETTPPLARLADASVPVLEQLRLVAGCTANVLVPYGQDTVGDPNFPAQGPAHQELAQALVGLAGESRSFDANGQWFKVLGTGGVETFTFGDLVGSVAQPLVGINPPVQTRKPPFRPDVPCETQDTPDLRSNPQKAPHGQPAGEGERSAVGREVGLEVLMRRLRGQGLDVVKGDGPITTGQIERLAARNGVSDQLGRLRAAVEQGVTLPNMSGGG